MGEKQYFIIEGTSGNIWLAYCKNNICIEIRCISNMSYSKIKEILNATNINISKIGVPYAAGEAAIYEYKRMINNPAIIVLASKYGTYSPLCSTNDSPRSEAAKKFMQS